MPDRRAVGVRDIGLRGRVRPAGLETAARIRGAHVFSMAYPSPAAPELLVAVAQRRGRAALGVQRCSLS